jgi:hypothetical protein
MAENDPNPNPNPNPAPDAGKDAAYWQAEARKAFEARDEAKRLAKELSGKVMSDDDAELFKKLREADAKTEEERKRKAGEFDSWRKDILTKHQQELADRDKRVSEAEGKARKTLIGLAFAGASDLFGKEALTIYGPKAGERIFSEFVDLDEDGSVVVKSRAGHVILDADTGKPASFAVALKELIESLPDKNDHLRGSGKTGSGSAGGGPPGSPADITDLTTRARAGDKDAIKALQQRRASSGALVMGSAFSQR